MKKTACCIIATIGLLILCGCQQQKKHVHSWRMATCVEPMVCMECGEIQGEPLGHKWAQATCTEPKTCSVCGINEGDPLGHDWVDATCTAPITCARCAQSKGAPLGHEWIEATCTVPRTCAVCGKTEGQPLGHTVEEWTTLKESTCTEQGSESGVCTVCGIEVEREKALQDHTPGEWEVGVQATETTAGQRYQRCTVCGKVLDTETFSLTAAELKQLYISECKTISYDSLARTPDDYKGERVKFSGYVVQVCSEARSSDYYSTYRVATSGKYNNVVYIRVDNYGSGTRILEDDYITFYGEYDGIYTYTTVMGSSLSIPQITVKYVD